MKTKAILIGLLGAMMLTLPVLVHPETLGKVTFPTSCDARVQANFERGVAMLHSYWFTEARKVFEAVLEQDAGCAMAYWGLAVNYLGNSLASAPSAKDVAAAWAGLDKARAIGARTPRERDWIEAISVYYRDADTVALDARLLAYTEAMERMTRRYPDDLEAWTYYALTLQASAPRNDKAYGHQLRSAEILERLFKQNPAARILWAHSGFDSPDTIRAMLAKHRNLWCDLAFRSEQGSGGKVPAEWRALLTDFPDRFMVGTDTYTPERWHYIVEHAAWSRAWLADLPPPLAERIAWRNADALFAGPFVKSAPARSQ